MKQSTILYIVLACFGFYLLGTWSGERNADMYVDFEVPTDVIKTVAHVDVANDNLELIYKDISEDIAYYRFIGVRDIATVGDVVHLYDGTEFTITSTSINGFNLDSGKDVEVGMSGMAILDKDNNQIGYVSALLPTGEVYCIWS